MRPDPALVVLTNAGLVREMTQFQCGLPDALAAAFRDFAPHGPRPRRRGVVLCKLLEGQHVALAMQLLSVFPHTNDVAIDQTSRGDEVYTMDHAAAAHSVALLETLHRRRLGRCSTNALDIAAAHGDWPSIRFLVTHRREGGSRRAFFNGIIHGHHDVVAYLRTHRPDDKKVLERSPLHSYAVRSPSRHDCVVQ